MFRKLSFAPTYKTLLSTRQTAVAACRLSDSSDDQTSDGAHKRAFPYSHIAINYPPSDKSDGPPFSPERSFVLQVSPCVSFSVLIFYKRIFRCTLPFQIASKSDRKNSCRFFVVLKEAIRLLLRANYKEFSKLKNGSSCPYALASSLATSRLSRC